MSLVFCVCCSGKENFFSSSWRVKTCFKNISRENVPAKHLNTRAKGKQKRSVVLCFLVFNSFYYENSKTKAHESPSGLMNMFKKKAETWNVKKLKKNWDHATTATTRCVISLTQLFPAHHHVFPVIN